VRTALIFNWTRRNLDGWCPKFHKVCLLSHWRLNSCRKHAILDSREIRSLCCTSLGSAAPWSKYLTPSVGDLTSETPGYLQLALRILERLELDHVSKRRIFCLNFL
jgi:hypothetical protein